MNKYKKDIDYAVFVQTNGRFPYAEEMYKNPITWIPTKPSNPSKLELCVFDNGEWIGTGSVKFVAWPEAFQ